MAGTTYSGVATVTADLTEATRLGKEASVAFMEAGNIAGVGQLVGSVAATVASEYSKASAQERAQKNITDQGTAKQGSTNSLQEFKSQHSEQESKQFVDAEIEGARADYENGLISEGTYKGKMAVFQNALGPQGRAAQIEVDGKVNNTMVRGMSADILSGVNPKTDENKAVYFSAGGSNAGWRDVNIEAAETASMDLVQLADSPEQLRSVAAWRQNQINDLRSDPNYKGKNADQVWSKHNQRYQAVYKAKLDSLNKDLDADAANMEQSYSATPNEYNDNKIARYGKGTKEYINQTTKYEEGYDDYITTNEYLRAGNPVEGYNDAALATTKNGTKIKKEHVQGFQQQALTDGDLPNLIKSIGSNPGDSTEIGKTITKQMKNFQTEEEGLLKYQGFGAMLAQPNGANALAQSQTPKAYKESRLAYELHKSGISTSATNAREASQQIIASQTLAKVSMQPQDKNYMFKKASEVGIEQGEFVFLTTNMMALGMDAVEATDMVASLYADRQLEMGDVVIQNKPSGLNIGDEDAFSADIESQLKIALKDEDAEISQYTIRATDDDSGTAIIHSRETGMPVGLINLTQASQVSLDPDVLAGVSGERGIRQDITNFVEKATNVLAETVEDPTGTLIDTVQSMREGKREFFQALKSGGRLGTGTSITEGTGEFMGVEPMGPAELFSAIGSGIDYLSGKGGQVIEYLTPAEFRNPGEAQQVQLLKQVEVAEIANSINKLDSMRTVVRKDNKEFSIPEIVDNKAYGAVLSRLADEADVLDTSNINFEEDPNTGELRVIMPSAKEKKNVELNNFTSKEFITMIQPISNTIAKDVGGNVQPKWIEAMLRHETGNGSGTIFKMTNNLGSIKKSENWKGKTYAVDAWEVDKQGNSYNEPSEFKVYDSIEASTKDYANILKSPRYKDALKATTKRGFFQSLKDSGYMTDPEYVDKMMRF